jgi:iron complex outermembrane receptor protein
MFKTARITALMIFVLVAGTGMPAGAAETVTLETVTVTAQKRVEDVQDVPASVTTLTATQIEDAAITDTTDLVVALPNMHMQHNYAENVIIIRGLSSFNTSIYSPAGLYVDDVAYPLHYMHNPEFLDIERIEVLKGPQGTLYGRNSESGVINIVTRQPGDRIGGEVFGEYGSFGTYRLGGRISGPIVDDILALGLAVQQKFSDGFVENQHNGDEAAADLDHKNARFNLVWTPSRRLSLRLIGDWMETDDHAAGYRTACGR